MNSKQIAKEILAQVGGLPNIISMTHCTTRLRFELLDKSKADKEAVEAIDGVLTVIERAGQFQAVIGLSVMEVYREVEAIQMGSANDTLLSNHHTSKARTLSTPVSLKQNQMIYSPLQGKVMDLNKVADPAFASLAIGQGIAVLPTKGEVISPVDGTISATFQTTHAIGVSSDYGIEILIHIGINTVQLEGKYFEIHVKEGDRVLKGQKLMTFELDKILEEGYDISTPIVITNSDLYIEVVQTTSATIDFGEILMKIR